MQKGWFITFEGPDGSGKTTISTNVYQKLLTSGLDVIYTREPGGIDIAEQIRGIILDPKNTAMDVKTEALLYAASRRQHLVEKVLPAIQAGKIVICDRFVDSSLAYQGVGRGIGIEEVLSINEFAIEGYYPDVTLFLDIDPIEGLKRISNRHYRDRLDREAEDFHLKVALGYQEVLKRYRHRMQVLDANRPVEEIVNEAVQYILAKVKPSV
ncbi:MAG TPA: dTMP kinase [Erysipelotrichaceae bacterium]|nr:dTMP kinase [Erysipelotrichaceae bacterium]